MQNRTNVLNLVIVLVTFLLSGVAKAEDRQHVIVVVGAAGTDEYGAMFGEWADRWRQAATEGQCDLTIVGQDDQSDDLTSLKHCVTELVQSPSKESVWLVLIGHGTFDGREARFNLRGQDLTAAERAAILQPVQRPVAVINCSSCSSPFLNALSGSGRIIVTATKDGAEIQFSRFGDYLSAAIGNPDADIDRDGQTSLLEAWLQASRRTEEFYESEGRLATEHSLLDDTGDGKGSRAELYEGVRIRDNVKDQQQVDGRLAHRWHLVRSEAERQLTPEHRQQRDELEDQLEKLRQRKTTFADEAEYLQALEKILVPLARIYHSAAADAAEASASKP